MNLFDGAHRFKYQTLQERENSNLNDEFQRSS
jgi:hypothetical protein